MSSEIGRLVNTQLVSVGPRHTLLEAARRMNEAKVGSAVVLDDGQPAIITERDLLRAVAENASLESSYVEDYMTANAVTASASWDVLQAADCMLNGGFRHLIVMGEDGQPLGMLSIRDLCKSLVEQLEAGAGSRR